ncbi:MAG TPA: PDZ domain-containing protein, partial [Vulgatibacter sp.]
AFAQGQDLPGAPHAITGPDGTFRLAGVEAGRRPVFAFHPGFRAARPVVVDALAGRATRAEIRLAPGGTAGEEVFGGIGLTLGADRRRAVIAAEVVVGGPAFAAGVRRGDRIISVDGAPLPEGAGLGYAVARIRGPVGAPVTLDLERGGVRFRATAVRTELRY